MEYKNLDPNILYPVGTKVWCVEHGEGVIVNNNSNEIYTYVVELLSKELLTYTKEGFYKKEDGNSSLFLLEEKKQFTAFENRAVIVSHKDEIWYNKVLAIQLEKGCLCYSNSTSDVSAVNVSDGFTYWKHMKEIPKLTFTKEEIAEKLNLDVDSLK
jgi:hypothetical protein